MTDNRDLPLLLRPQFRVHLPDGYVVVAFDGLMTRRSIGQLIRLLKAQADVLDEDSPPALMHPGDIGQEDGR